MKQMMIVGSVALAALLWERFSAKKPTIGNTARP